MTVIEALGIANRVPNRIAESTAIKTMHRNR